MNRDEIFWFLAASSVVMFVGSLIAVPAIIVRLPEDYFAHRHRHPIKPSGKRIGMHYVWLAGKNLLGVAFVVMGIAMLVLPGQGILSMLIGLSLLNFPGKYHLEQLIVSRDPVLRSLNWIRHRAGKPSLRLR
ncbi:putative transmembrane protein (PGPGW) [Planctomycetes bacterium CA13]|uniref:Putative transmembrane protein (PGPGW) n=1 Tax=Novipirellula herctigrandis TaxID=2527986 RepID=A0A5C5YYZ2_9BACT|nr:putative transmembrane protein (PGPGW) [Planctomycetes bacterium CA13]